MSLSSAVSKLESDLKAAYQKAADTGKESDPVADLAKDVATAIHDYATSAVVTTAVIVDGGQSVVGPVGSTTVAPAPWPGSVGTGKVSFDSSDFQALEGALKTAYENAKLSGETGQTMLSLATEVHDAIHNFAVAAIVETDVTVAPQQPLVPYPLTPPVPGVTGPGTGSGKGELS